MKIGVGYRFGAKKSEDWFIFDVKNVHFAKNERFFYIKILQKRHDLIFSG
jgi:hypothetical protein